MKTYPELAQLVGEMTKTERAIIFTVAELKNSCTLDEHQRMRRAQTVAETGNYLEATGGVIDLLGELAEQNNSFETLLAALINHHTLTVRPCPIRPN